MLAPDSHFACLISLQSYWETITSQSMQLRLVVKRIVIYIRGLKSLWSDLKSPGIFVGYSMSCFWGCVAEWIRDWGLEASIDNASRVDVRQRIPWKPKYEIIRPKFNVKVLNINKWTTLTALDLQLLDCSVILPSFFKSKIKLDHEDFKWRDRGECKILTFISKVIDEAVFCQL